MEIPTSIAPLVPVDVVTVTFLVPTVAFEAIANVAVIWVEFTTVTLLTVIPEPALTVAPEAKLVPVKVTGTLFPATPLLGLIDVSVGAVAPIVKV